MKKLLVLSLIVALTFCWSQANKIRKCQTYNCQVCSSIGVCVMCHPGHILSINKQTMVSQCVQQKCNMKNCFRCVDQNTCMQCQTGFTLNFKSQCIKDNLLRSEVQNRDEFCRTKSKEGDCLECFQGLELVQGKCLPELLKLSSVEQVSCNSSILNCISCLVPNFCTNCSAGLIPSANGANCINDCTVNISNCLLCSTGLTCSTCQNGYTLFQNNCIMMNITGCMSYFLNGSCEACYQQYTLSNETCTFSGCQYPCANCTFNSTTGAPICETCSAPFNLNALSNGTCFTCFVANCISCNDSTTSNCSLCVGNLTPVNGSCPLPCSSVPNSLCLSCPQNICTLCIQGFYLSANNSCLPCVNSTVCVSCNETNSSICYSCMQGYYLLNGTCFPCNEITCASCSNQTETLGQCQSYQASTGFLLYQSQNITAAYVCDIGCLSCAPNFPIQCLQCQPGFSLTINETTTIAQCLPCAPQCMTCAANNKTNCLTCFSNAILFNGNCTICNTTSNCLTCQTNVTRCTSCPPGYTVLNYVCSPCPINCLTCFNSSGTQLTGIQNNVACSSCNPGFGLSVSGYCLPCLYNCRVCSGIQQEICISCGQSFYLNGTTCTPCPIGCTTCVQQGCLTCGQNFILVANSTFAFCKLICPFPCSSCSFIDSSCTACLLGYSLNNGMCSATVNQTVGQVNYCGFGTYLDSKTSICLSCSNNCSRCSVPKVCTSCLYGYYLNYTNSSCLPCPPGCSTCSSLLNCISCENNYTLVNLPLLSNQPYCSQCALPCQQCTANNQECLSCIPGFNFTGFNCISNFYFLFTMQLEVDLPTFFNNYQPFMSQIQFALSTMNLRSSLVTQISNTSNSTTVVINLTTIVPSNTNLAAYEYSNLQFALLNQQTFGNMPVGSSSLQAINGIVPVITSNVPMICGIVIPIGVVLVVGLLYFIFSRNNIDLPGSNYVPLEVSAPTRMTQLRQIE